MSLEDLAKEVYRTETISKENLDNLNSAIHSLSPLYLEYLDLRYAIHTREVMLTPKEIANGEGGNIRPEYIMGILDQAIALTRKRLNIN
ncbi:hypothetical protein J4461_02960 [Candidatus Pacearchaeota archaeon]|nr:hypothetical protein [Candidatus Pacearchaeota archaeon]